MSRNLIKSSDFIRILLQNNLKLSKILLTHATSSQLQAVAEIFYNVFKLPLNKKKKEQFLKNIKLLKRFLEDKKGRKQLILRKLRIFSNLLQIIKPFLLQILK